MANRTDTQDDAAAACALIQYKVAIVPGVRSACRENHICFSKEPNNYDAPPTKRLRTAESRLQQTTTNALIANKWGNDSISIVGVCRTGTPSVSQDELERYPDTFGRVTVQASGVATVIVSDVDKAMRVGQYVAVSETLTDSGDNAYTTFQLTVAKRNGRADRFLGRLCNIKLMLDGHVELAVLLMLRPPTQTNTLHTSIFADEDSLFHAYIPPTLMHTVWALITPRESDVENEEEERTEETTVLTRAVAVARDKNMHQVVAALESAMYESQRASLLRPEFPRVEDMSTAGMQAFLIGNKTSKGVLWYYSSLSDLRSAIPLLLKHRRTESSGNGGREHGLVSASMFWTDQEMELMISFLNWSRTSVDHIQNAHIDNVKAIFDEVKRQ